MLIAAQHHNNQMSAFEFTSVHQKATNKVDHSLEQPSAAVVINRKEIKMTTPTRVQIVEMRCENSRSRICKTVAKEISINLLAGRKQRGVLSPAFISFTIITYLCASQSIATLISTGKDVKSNKIGGDLNSWSLDEAIVDSNGPNAYRTQLSPIVFASANPAPEPVPTPSASRSSSTRTHREPPISGSIFGKRSADSQSNKASRAAISSSQANVATSQAQEQKFLLARKDKKQPTSEPLDYKDIITDLIEDFLALNKDDNPEETSVQFCRMIVYECSQMLSARSRSRKPTKGRINSRTQREK